MPIELHNAKWGSVKDVPGVESRDTVARQKSFPLLPHAWTATLHGRPLRRRITARSLVIS